DLARGAGARAADAARRSGRWLADLGDLPVAVPPVAVAVPRELLVELLELLHALRVAHGVPVEDLPLGHLRLVDAPGLRDRRLLLGGQRALHDAAFLVLLAKPLHRELVRALRSAVRHGRTSLSRRFGSVS